MSVAVGSQIQSSLFYSIQKKQEKVNERAVESAWVPFQEGLTEGSSVSNLPLSHLLFRLGGLLYEYSCFLKLANRSPKARPETLNQHSLSALLTCRCAEYSTISMLVRRLALERCVLWRGAVHTHALRVHAPSACTQVTPHWRSSASRALSTAADPSSTHPGSKRAILARLQARVGFKLQQQRRCVWCKRSVV
jgi:hypothetical protein